MLRRGNFNKNGGINRENMTWRACGGVDHSEFSQFRIEKRPDRVQVAITHFRLLLMLILILFG